LLNTPFIGELILKGDVTAIKQAMSAGKQEGLQTFDQDLLRLCKGGLISEEDALRFADSPNNLRLALRGITVATTH
ncbi:type IV pili twitching motility protein PilT, partial [Candidatus Sumerlaeota bacterium]|nr:type IV pili twitching motility protein PilT [Candidatus Sumerlaeota bacterium]